MKARSLFFTGPHKVELQEEPLGPLGEGEVHVETALSAISPGSERLVYSGQAPKDLSADSALDSLPGDLSFPLKYGYAAVGYVRAIGPEVDPDWLDRPVFAFHPHTSGFNIKAESLIRLPAELALEDAAFLPNMETAVNFLHDGAPLLGERVLVLGQGIVGLLTTSLLAKIPLSALLTADPVPTRRALSLDAGADASYRPEEIEGIAKLERSLNLGSVKGGADLVYELSGNPRALNLAIHCAGFGARILIGSWYGTRHADNLDLGAAFHRQRITISSSQVSTINPALSGRWDKGRRKELVLRLLQDMKPSRWITHRFDIGEAQLAYQHLDDPGAIQIVLTYDKGETDPG